MLDRLTIDSNAPEVERLLAEEFPNFLRAAMNRGYEKVAKDFAKQLVVQVFNVEGLYKVRRATWKGFTKQQGKNYKKVNITKKARVAGFRAEILQRYAYTGRKLVLRTGNEALIAKEFGDVADAPAGGWLYVRIREEKRGRKKKKKFHPRPNRQRGKNNPKPKEFVGFGIRKKKRVEIKAKLRIQERWKAFEPELKQILSASLDSAARRAESSSQDRLINSLFLEGSDSYDS